MQRVKGPRLYLEEREGRDPTWIIRDGSERRRTSLPPERYEEAKQKLAEYIAETYRPEPIKAQASEISIAEVLAYYATQIIREAGRRNTRSAQLALATRQIHIKNLLTFWAEKKIADVRTSVCQEYEDHRLAQPPRRGMRKGATSVASSTIRQELKTLGRAITAWHGESPLDALPIVWKPEEGQPRQRYLERAEAARMIRAARALGFDYLARYILIGVYTATRDNAMLRLRWLKATHDGYVDLDRGILYRAGTAEKQTTKGRPPMILPDRLLAHLRRWAITDQTVGASHAIHRHGRCVGDIHKSWATVRGAAGLGSDVTPHTLKHTAITWMLWQGLTFWEVSEATGTSAKTVQDVYGHHRTVQSQLDRKRQSAAKLPRSK